MTVAWSGSSASTLAARASLFQVPLAANLDREIDTHVDNLAPGLHLTKFLEASWKGLGSIGLILKAKIYIF